MKKWLLTSICILLSTAVLFPFHSAAWQADLPPEANTEPTAQVTSAAHGGKENLAEHARAAVLLDAETGTIIFEKNSHDQLPPASITKVMTMLIIMETIKAGKLKLSDKVSTSEHAASMGGSQIFLEPGEEMTVEEMLKGIAMASGNDASVAMAEKIAGSEQAFVQIMNERARELGMKNTHFMNCNGLPAENHYTSAHDIAQMSRALTQYANVTKFTGAYEDYLRQNTNKKFWLVNTNKLVRFYRGADGLKTGYTSAAKYCLSATAKRDNMRVIAVVLGEPSTKTRNAEVTQMFDYAFGHYTNVLLLKVGEHIGNIWVEKGELEQLEVKAQQPYTVLLKKGDAKQPIRFKLNTTHPMKAPIQVGQAIGRIIVYQGEKVIREFPVQATQPVASAGWWTLLKRTCSRLYFVK